MNIEQCPKYSHYCHDCKFIGTYDGCDLYFCKTCGKYQPTVVARYGDEIEKYQTGHHFGKVSLKDKWTHTPLRVAQLIAKDLGLIER
jgi:hypothetical protein